MTKLTDVEIVYTITLIEAVLRENMMKEFVVATLGTRGITIIEAARDKLDEQLRQIRKGE